MRSNHPMETNTAAVTVKITSISERFDNTIFADVAGPDMAILLPPKLVPAQFAAMHESGNGTRLPISNVRFHGSY
jgi:hypothetical protein